MGTFYSNNDYRDYLSHHGIKNQRWGVRHGPPYPLDDKKSRKIMSGKNPPAVDALRSISDIARSGEKIHDRRKQNRSSNKKDYTHEIKNIPDYELRKIVNRKVLEQQYNDIRNKEEYRLGEDKLKDALFYTAEIASIAASITITTAALTKIINKS